MASKWPIYKKELLSIGNPNSNIGLCTLWTEKEKILPFISKENYQIAGQCYSNNEGISLIIRHILANKQIKYLILTGADLNYTGDALLALKNKGINNKKQIIGFETAEIESEIPIEAIERFRQNIEIIDKRKTSPEELNSFLSTLPKTQPWGSPEIFKRLPPKKPESYPSEKTGFIIRGEKVGDTWLQILDTILKFGFIKKSQYSDDQQEITCLTSIITNENPNRIDWKPYFQFSKNHLKKYLPQLLTSNKFEGVSYTYGSRLRDFKGINQIDSIIQQLKTALYSRRAIAVTWDVGEDHLSSHGPCLDLIQALVQDKLHLTAYLRSNDMFAAWPENALALRKIQYEIAEKIGVKPGDLIMISNSAHIYSSDWKKTKNILKKYQIKPTKKPDPRGNLIIELEKDNIKITHLSPLGKPLKEFYAKTAMQAYQQLAKNSIISQISHALYLGAELGKAETALKLNLRYTQDKSL